MSKKSRENKVQAMAQATASDITVVETTAVETTVQSIEGKPYIELVDAQFRAEVDSLSQIKGKRSIRLGLATEGTKKGKDTIEVLKIAIEAIFRKIDKSESAHCLKGDVARIVTELTGYAGKHSPDYCLHSSLNRLGGNQFKYSQKKSKDKSYTADSWGLTTRSDLRAMLFISIEGMREGSGNIYLNPVVYAMGGYTRSTQAELQAACNHVVARFKK